jgi:hypothetical protein
MYAMLCFVAGFAKNFDIAGVHPLNTAMIIVHMVDMQLAIFRPAFLTLEMSRLEELPSDILPIPRLEIFGVGHGGQVLFTLPSHAPSAPIFHAVGLRLAEIPFPLFLASIFSGRTAHKILSFPTTERID